MQVHIYHCHCCLRAIYAWFNIYGWDTGLLVFQQYSYKGNGPPFVYFGMDDLNPTVETEVRFSDEAVLHRLCGVIYYVSNHFICRIVDKSRNIWFHDGYKMTSTVKYVKNSTTMSNNGWLKTGNYKASGLIYTKIY